MDNLLDFLKDFLCTDPSNKEEIELLHRRARNILAQSESIQRDLEKNVYTYYKN